MTDPGRPLRELLDARVSEREIHEVWQGVKERRAARRSRRLTLLAAACMAAALFLFVFVRHPGAELAPDADAAGPLAVTDGAHERRLAGGDAILVPTALSDGSRVALRPGARLSVVENSGRTFVTHLERGHADFSVKPGGPRRWVVECGGPTIEVVGTEFTVDRSALGLRVDVRHGVVVVRGEDVPDRIRRLAAGDTLQVPVREATSLDPLTGPATSVAATPSVPSAPATVPFPSASVAATTPPTGTPSVGTTTAQPANAALYDEADRARRAGEPAEAAQSLERAVATEPRGHRAALGYFTLGRLYLDELGKPGAAAHAFERSLAAGPPLGLEEDVRARLVEARARTSDVAGARRAAEEYRARFPAGRRAAEVARWCPGE